MNKKNIVFIIPGLQAGGAERVQMVMSNHWANLGHNVSLLLLSNAEPFYKINDRINVLKKNLNSNSKSPIVNFLKGLFEIRKFVKSNNADVVISFMPISNIQTIISLIGLTVKHIISERNYPILDSNIDYKWKVLRNMLYHRADILVVQTQESVNIWRGLISKIPKTEVINNPISDVFKPNDEIPKQNVILTVGSFSEQKRHLDLIDLYSKLNTSWKLIIVGDGKLRKKYEEKIKSYNLQDHVLLVGRVKDPEYYYSIARIYVHCSEYEGFPNALCEAMFCGSSVLSFDCPTGPKEIIEDNINGLLIENNNFELLQKKIQICINDEDLRLRLSTNAVKLSEKLNVGTIMKQWDLLL